MQPNNSPEYQSFIFSPLRYYEGQQRFKNQLRKVEAMFKPKPEITMRKAIAELGCKLHPQPAEGGYLELRQYDDSTYCIEWHKENAVCHCFIPDTWTQEAESGRSLTLMGQLIATWHFTPNYSPTVEEWLQYIAKWLMTTGQKYNLPEDITPSAILIGTYSTDITSPQKARTVMQRWAEANINVG